VKEKEIIDKGEILIENKEDISVTARFLKALGEGDETYKPKGLKLNLKQKQELQDELINNFNSHDDDSYLKSNINFI